MTDKLIGWDEDGIFLIVETNGKTELMVPDFTAMTRDELIEYKDRINDKIRTMNENEPKRKGEAFDKWEELHEELEDIRDELYEFIDVM